MALRQDLGFSCREATGLVLDAELEMLVIAEAEASPAHELDHRIESFGAAATAAILTFPNMRGGVGQLDSI